MFDTVYSGSFPNNHPLDHMPSSVRTPLFTFKTVTSCVVKDATQTIHRRKVRGEDRLDPYLALCALLITDQKTNIFSLSSSSVDL